MQENPKILIVDDDRQFRAMTRKMLEVHGYTVVENKIAADVIPQIQKEKPSLIILDWNLPNHNGLHLCKEIKSHQSIQPIYILMVSSAITNRNDLESFFWAGADNFMSKPLTKKELLISVRTGLQFIAAVKENEKTISTLTTRQADFMTSLSYDLIAPVTNLKLNFELAKLNYEKRAKYETIIDQNLGHLENLIKTVREYLILDVVHLEKTKYAPVNINDILEKALNTHSHQISAKEITLLYTPYHHPISVLSFENQLLIAFKHIVQSKVQMTHSNHLSVGVTMLNETELIVYFLDSNNSLEETDPHYQNTIQEQIESEEEISRGVGLGFTISRKIVDAHSGHFIANPEPGWGGIFIVLPISQPRQKAQDMPAYRSQAQLSGE